MSKKDWKKLHEKRPSTKDEAIHDAEEQPIQGALEHPSYEELEEKLTLAEQRADENEKKFLLSVADAKNIERRTEIRLREAFSSRIADLINLLVPVNESMRQALESAQKGQVANIVEGLELTLKLFRDALQKQGVEEIDPLGEKFNPQEHEAMSVQQDLTQDPDTVLMVFQKGYKFNDRVIRAARVIVNKHN